MTIEQIGEAMAIFWGSVTAFLLLWATMIKEKPVYESFYRKFK